jgi:hypothetical protein
MAAHAIVGKRQSMMAYRVVFDDNVESGGGERPTVPSHPSPEEDNERVKQSLSSAQQ